MGDWPAGAVAGWFLIQIGARSDPDRRRGRSGLAGGSIVEQWGSRGLQRAWTLLLGEQRPEQEKDVTKILAVMISMTAIVTVAVVLFA